MRKPWAYGIGTDPSGLHGWVYGGDRVNLVDTGLMANGCSKRQPKYRPQRASVFDVFGSSMMGTQRRKNSSSTVRLSKSLNLASQYAYLHTA